MDIEEIIEHPGYNPVLLDNDFVLFKYDISLHIYIVVHQKKFITQHYFCSGWQHECPWLTTPISDRSACPRYVGTTASWLSFPPTFHTKGWRWRARNSHHRCWLGIPVRRLWLAIWSPHVGLVSVSEYECHLVRMANLSIISNDECKQQSSYPAEEITVKIPYQLYVKVSIRKTCFVRSQVTSAASQYKMRVRCRNYLDDYSLAVSQGDSGGPLISKGSGDGTSPGQVGGGLLVFLYLYSRFSLTFRMENWLSWKLW